MTAATAHVPVRVTARLRTGVSMDAPYGLDLAGILAARERSRLRAAQTDAARLLTPLPDTTGEEPEDLMLPLGRCTRGAVGWHWLASCAIAVDPDPDPEPRTFYRTTDSMWAQNAATRPLAYHHPRKGPYRDVMMPSPVVICGALEWRAVGDPDGILALVHGIRFLGRRRSVGEGGVLDWVVELVDADADQWTHTHADTGALIRPMPVECAEFHGVPYRWGQYALRPPSWHPDRLVDLAMTPDDDDAWAEDDAWGLA